MKSAFALAVLLALCDAVQAAELDGVTMPPTRESAGRTMRLNGMGVRLYSVFRVRVYVASLYLTAPAHDAEAVMASAAPKLIAVRYLRDIGQADAHAAWRHYFDANCLAPCPVQATSVERFLALTPAIAADRLQVALNGRTLGAVPDGAFARLLLATFIGTQPTSEALKRALLGG